MAHRGSPTRYGRIVASTLNPQSKARLCRLFLLGDDLRRVIAPGPSPAAGGGAMSGVCGTLGSSPYSSVRAALADVETDADAPICLTYPSSAPSERGEERGGSYRYRSDGEDIRDIDGRSLTQSRRSSVLGSRVNHTSAPGSATYSDDLEKEPLFSQHHGGRSAARSDEDRSRADHDGEQPRGGRRRSVASTAARQPLAAHSHAAREGGSARSRSPASSRMAAAAGDGLGAAASRVTAADRSPTTEQASLQRRAALAAVADALRQSPAAALTSRRRTAARVPIIYGDQETRPERSSEDGMGTFALRGGRSARGASARRRGRSRMRSASRKAGRSRSGLRVPSNSRGILRERRDNGNSLGHTSAYDAKGLRPWYNETSRSRSPRIVRKELTEESARWVDEASCEICIQRGVNQVPTFLAR